MKLFNVFLLVFCLGFTMSCATDGDGGCTKEDWIGTYTLNDSTSNCSDPNITLSDMVTILDGSSNGTLSYEGVEVEFDGCMLSESSFIFSATLNGRSMSISAFGCTGTYNKN